MIYGENAVFYYATYNFFFIPRRYTTVLFENKKSTHWSARSQRWRAIVTSQPSELRAGARTTDKSRISQQKFCHSSPSFRLTKRKSKMEGVREWKQRKRDAMRKNYGQHYKGYKHRTSLRVRRPRSFTVITRTTTSHEQVRHDMSSMWIEISSEFCQYSCKWKKLMNVQDNKESQSRIWKKKYLVILVFREWLPKFIPRWS